MTFRHVNAFRLIVWTSYTLYTLAIVTGTQAILELQKCKKGNDDVISIETSPEACMDQCKAREFCTSVSYHVYAKVCFMHGTAAMEDGTDNCKSFGYAAKAAWTEATLSCGSPNCDQNRATCTAEGMCKYQDCPVPGQSAGKLRLLGNLRSMGAKIAYMCSGNYVLHGAKSLTCLLGGAWSHAFPSCHPPSTVPPETTTTATTTTTTYVGTTTLYGTATTVPVGTTTKAPAGTTTAYSETTTTAPGETTTQTASETMTTIHDGAATTPAETTTTTTPAATTTTTQGETTTTTPAETTTTTPAETTATTPTETTTTTTSATTTTTPAETTTTTPTETTTTTPTETTTTTTPSTTTTTPAETAEPITSTIEQTTATASFSCDNGWYRYRESCYSVTTEPAPFDEAHMWCPPDSMIAVPNTVEENYFIRSILSNQYNYWVGIKLNTNLEWVGAGSGTVLNYNDWHDGQVPAGALENCAMYYINVGHAWYGWNCGTPLHALCKKPATVTAG